jgi:hypothetical protein
VRDHAAEAGVVAHGPTPLPDDLRRIAITTVLPGHDVLDVKRDVNGSLRETAVLAAMVSALPHQFSNRCIHLRCALGENQPRLGLEYPDEVDALDVLLVLDTLIGRQLSLVGLASQFIDPPLRRRIGTLVDDPLSHIWRPAVCQGIEQAVEN